MKKILLAMPSIEGKIPKETVRALLQLQVPEWYSIDHWFTARTLIHQARNAYLQLAMDKWYDYIFFLDDDNPCPSDTLYRLLRHNQDIVTWLVPSRTHNKNWTRLLNIFKSQIHPHWHIEYLQYEKISRKYELIEIENCGTGCVLISRNVIEALYNKYHTMPFEFRTYRYKKPQEEHTEEIKQEQINDLDIDINTYTRSISEDLLFFERAKKEWFKIYADCTIKCEHIGEHYISKVDNKFYVEWEIDATINIESILESVDHIQWDYILYTKNIEVVTQELIENLKKIIHWNVVLSTTKISVNGEEQEINQNTINEYLFLIKKSDRKKYIKPLTTEQIETMTIEEQTKYIYDELEMNQKNIWIMDIITDFIIH
jgi:hypothetical protein